MPMHLRRDSKGSYYQWGNFGKKYYFKKASVRSRTIALQKAWKQARAIQWSKYTRRK